MQSTKVPRSTWDLESPNWRARLRSAERTVCFRASSRWPMLLFPALLGPNKTVSGAILSSFVSLQALKFLIRRVFSMCRSSLTLQCAYLHLFPWSPGGYRSIRFLRLVHTERIQADVRTQKYLLDLPRFRGYLVKPPSLVPPRAA